ncbi:MAG: phytoene/squalene synthase family protein [Hyphomonadaceae bacterium]|nr:phytoene/squalene synthase family protein [Hyphomonadaceae bacterium]
MRPNLHKPELASPGDLATCRLMIRTGSRSFYAASLLLPEQMRSGAYALYAFCRLSDDTVDVEQGGEAGIAKLASRLDAIYAGKPADGPIDRALFDAIDRYALPRAPFDALLEGMAWDVTGRGCETIGDLYAYAARVAGAVGAMMAVLMGSRAPAMVARASDLGVAMQLTNVARDVGEDARNGRLYLPRTWMRDAGLDPDAWLAQPVFNPAISSVVKLLLDRADALYSRAEIGIAALPSAYRPAIQAARLLYADIGAQVAKQGYNSVASRAIVPTSRKLQLLAGTLTRRWNLPIGEALRAPALPENQFLVDAIEAHTTSLDEAYAIPGLRHDVRWMVDLFAALDERPRRLA